LEQDYYIYDLEVYRNYFLFRSVRDSDRKEFNFVIDENINQLVSIVEFIQGKTLVGFNNKNYDDYLLEQLVKLHPRVSSTTKTNLEINSALKDLSDEIILIHERRPFPKLPYSCRTIDLMTLNRLDKLFKSLKQIGSEFLLTIQELPIHHDKWLSEDDKSKIFDYCGNDIEITLELFKRSYSELKLRISARNKYGLNSYVQSLDRPALAMSILGKYTELVKPEYSDPVINQVKDVVFDIIKFETPELNKWFEGLKEDYLTDKFSSFISIGTLHAKLAKGGLHSTMTDYFYEETDDYVLLDIDAGSFYPKIMINWEIAPKHLNKQSFLKGLKTITTERLDAKAKKITDVAEILKIVINAIFGQMGSTVSKLYDFEAMMKVTINGQLLLLMLAERLNRLADVVYANTDGLTIRVRKDVLDEIVKMCDDFSREINIPIEFARYKKMFIKNCNSYVVLKDNDELKLKGDYASFRDDISKGFSPEIVNKAAVEYLINNTPIHEFVKASSLDDFLEGQKVDRKFQVIAERFVDNKIVEHSLQKVNRYFVTNKTTPLTSRIYKVYEDKKLSLKDESLIVCNYKEDVYNESLRGLVDEKYYINEVKKLTSIFEKSNNQLLLFDGF